MAGRTQKLPPYRLVKRDPANITLGALIVLALTFSSRYRGIIPWEWLRRHVQAYTAWNWIFILTRIMLGQSQWDPFLLSNSMAICIGFRTAMTKSLSENMRSKLAVHGTPMSRLQFDAADHLCHTLPPFVLLFFMYRAKRKASVANGMLSLIGQVGRLNMSDLYAPHPAARAWFGSTVGHVMAPLLLNSLVAGERKKAALISFTMILPFLSSHLDPNLESRFYDPTGMKLRELAKKLKGQERQSMRDDLIVPPSVPKSSSHTTLRQAGA